MALMTPNRLVKYLGPGNTEARTTARAWSCSGKNTIGLMHRVCRIVYIHPPLLVNHRENWIMAAQAVLSLELQ